MLSPLAAAGPQQRPTFTTTVARVRVDVIVSDDEGRFVGDLRPDEFALYEDDVEQQILSTQIVDLAEGTVAEFVPGAAGGRDPADLPLPGELTTRPVPAAASRDFGAVIFLIDLPVLTDATRTALPRRGGRCSMERSCSAFPEPST